MDSYKLRNRVNKECFQNIDDYLKHIRYTENHTLKKNEPSYDRINYFENCTVKPKKSKVELI